MPRMNSSSSEDPTNYLSKTHQSYLKNEIIRFRFNRVAIATSVRISIKSNPILWPVLKPALEYNKVTFWEFMDKLCCFLLSDNSAIQLHDMNTFLKEKKLSRDCFKMVKKIVLIAFKEYGMSHALLTRIIESFTDLTSCFVENNVRQIETTY